MVNKFKDKDTQAIWEATQDYAPEFQPDTEVGLRRLKTKIQADKGAKVVPIRRRTWLRVAAAVALVIAAVVGLQSLQPSVEWESITAQNERQEVILPDGSQVWLREAATLSYVTDFVGDERQLKLDGEAFFEVKHNPVKPFVIQVGKGNVTVLGTSFSIDTDAHTTEVLVKTGKVAFSAREDVEAVYLTKNMKATYAAGTSQAMVKSSVSSNELAWQTQVLQYRGTMLTEIFNDFEEAYGVTINLENKELSTCKYTDIIKLNGKTIEEALSNILADMRLEITEKDGVYHLKGGLSNCH